MQDTPKKPEQTPTEIARETLRRLAARRMPPTPDAYRETYDEIAGVREQSAAEKVLSEFVNSMVNGPDDVAAQAYQIGYALKMRDWQKCRTQLTRLAELLKRQTRETGDSAPAATPAETHEKPEAGGKITRESIPLVDPPPPEPKLKSAGIPLVDDLLPPEQDLQVVTVYPVPDENKLPAAAPAMEILPAEPLSGAGGPAHSRILRDMLVRTWSLAVAALLQNSPEFASEAEAMASAIHVARSETELNELNTRLKELCFKIELKSADIAEEHELLLRLFKLLFQNIGELVEDDSWVSGQIARVRELLAGPIDHAVLMAVSHNLKDVIYKQSTVKQQMKEARTRLKTMMQTFIERIGVITDNAGNYHKKVAAYSQQIASAKDILDLNKILDQVMFDTQVAQTDALRAREQMEAARDEMKSAEERIQALQLQLQQMSELAREDQLTGSLNRRGLDDVLEREISRSERNKSPLCIALLDLDDFKKLNDTHGHSAGDKALIHVVRVVKETLRSMDVIARFGGEEFLIVLPDTPLEDAVQTVTRIQRELTKRIFLHNHQKLLITFSGGVALRRPGEEQASLIERADQAAYKAKKAGKNRVVVAD